MMEETGSPVSFELLGTGFEFLDISIKLGEHLILSEVNKFTVPVPFVMELRL
ncbi:hypothetical protein [Clostridium sp. ATCC 25772]|uniref:hypothetical protein n=1 Tax=Clostridium sp. ATCC 25772 TaxID=1676991 RepID=UPI000AF24F86|nr:hypothetical protein [Clostridium sp. ATCC 25772]